MKNILSIFALVLASFAFAQAPSTFSYQAVVRNATNTLVTNQAVGIKFSVLKSSVTGSVVYSETQNSTTNANGLISTELGSGTVISGSLTSIDWSADKYFVKTEIDPTGGTSYTISGTQQFLSVPYALNAKTADNGLKNGTAGGQLVVTGSSSPFAPQAPATVTGDITFNSNAVSSISSNAVTTDKITDGAVTTGKLSDASVTTGKISATGTAGSSTYLRGDGKWAVPSSGGSAVLELMADKVSGTPETNIPTSASNNVIPVIFNNVNTATTLGSYNSTTGEYTAASAGVYMVQARVHGLDASPTNNTVSYCLNIQINNAVWGSTAGGIIYGVYTPINVYTPSGTKARGEILCYIKLNSGDKFRVVMHGTNSSVAAPNTIPDAGCNLMIVKIN